MFASSASRVSHGDHVWLAGEDTGESLGRAITTLLKNQRLRARIASGGYRFVREHHDRRNVAAQLCRAYVRLLKGTRRWPEIAARPTVGSLNQTTVAGADWRSDANEYVEADVHAIA
jgi:hypothetical protein